MSKTFDNSQIINQVQSFKGFKNRIINGGFQVKQRGGGGIINKQDFILDRFQSQTAGSLITAKDLLVLPDSIPLVDNVDPFGDGSGIALWKLDGNANDASGNYNGTWHGTEQYDNGVFGKCASFDGNSYIDTGLSIPDENLTVSIWFNVKGTNISNKDQRLWSLNINGGGDENVTGVNIYMGRLNFYKKRDGLLDYRIESDNYFHNIIFNVKDNEIYFNGRKLRIDYKGTYRFTGQYTMWLARYSGNDKQYYTGLIDQVRVFNRGLTEEEIQKLYLEESKVIKKPYTITLKTGNNPSDYSTQTIKHLVYRFEGQHLYDLISEGKKATLSFKMNARKVGKYSVALINKTTSNYETLLQTFDYNGNQDELVSVTFDLDQFQNEVRNDENLGCELVVCGYTEDNNLVGSVGRNDGEKICASGCVAIDDNDSISVTGLQLEEGEYATDFEIIPYDVELMRCMRYYEVNDVEILTNAGDASHSVWLFKVIKRVIPSINLKTDDGFLQIVTRQGIRTKENNNLYASIGAGTTADAEI